MIACDGEDYESILLVVEKDEHDPPGFFNAVPLVDNGDEEIEGQAGRHIPMPARKIKLSDKSWRHIQIRWFKELVERLLKEGAEQTKRKQTAVNVTIPLNQPELSRIISVRMRKYGKGVQNVCLVETSTMQKQPIGIRRQDLFSILTNDTFKTAARLDSPGHMNHFGAHTRAWWNSFDGHARIDNQETALGAHTDDHGADVDSSADGCGTDATPWTESYDTYTDNAAEDLGMAMAPTETLAVPPNVGQEVFVMTAGSGAGGEYSLQEVRATGADKAYPKDSASAPATSSLFSNGLCAGADTDSNADDTMDLSEAEFVAACTERAKCVAEVDEALQQLLGGFADARALLQEVTDDEAPPHSPPFQVGALQKLGCKRSRPADLDVVLEETFDAAMGVYHRLRHAHNRLKLASDVEWTTSESIAVQKAVEQKRLDLQKAKEQCYRCAIDALRQHNLSGKERYIAELEASAETPPEDDDEARALQAAETCIKANRRAALRRLHEFDKAHKLAMNAGVANLEGAP